MLKKYITNISRNYIYIKIKHRYNYLTMKYRNYIKTLTPGCGMHR